MVSEIPSLRRSCRGFPGWGGSALQTRGPSYPTMPFTVWSRRAAEDVFRVQDGNIRIEIKAFCCHFFFVSLLLTTALWFISESVAAQSEQSDNFDSSCHWCFTDEEVLRAAMVDCPRNNDFGAVEDTPSTHSQNHLNPIVFADSYFFSHPVNVEIGLKGPQF